MPWIGNLQTPASPHSAEQGSSNTILLSSSGITGISIGSTRHIPWSEVLLTVPTSNPEPTSIPSPK